jgi:tetratricopeptide (TPR) repeat protein
MNPLATVVVSVLLASAAATAVVLTLRPADPGVDGGALAELQRTVGELRERNDALQRRVEGLANAPAPVAAPAPASDRAAAPAVSGEQIAAAVDAWLRKHAAGGGELAATVAAAATKPAFDLDAEFDALKGTSYWEAAELWKRLFAAGKMDEAIARFEELAKANPTDTKVQMDLANAYLSYLQMDQSKWQLSMKADSVFDKVLALDERHWEARFSKAMSYTFWPDFLGKKKEAIAHFETLVQQQESMPPHAHEAQTYLFLGNLLEQRDPAKAREVWKKGALRHPDNQDLAKKAGG